MTVKTRCSHCPIGLVPAAVGGTALKEWLPDCRYYTNAVERCRAALAAGGKLKGILWHQGCADSVKEGDAESYADRLTVLVLALRKEFGDVPFVAGEVGRFLDGYVWKGPDGREVRLGHWRTVNEQIHLAASRIGRMRVVCSDGLVDRGDSLHFDTPSQRILGRRYAKAMKELLADGAGRAVQESE